MIEFRIRPHNIRDVNIVEVWRDGSMIATITPGVEPISTVHIVTKHEIAAVEDRSSGTTPLTTIAITIRVKQ